ncbi:MAG: hypothetical protein K0S44_1426 [Bacteroidetes bacterium]|jgi:hypothetical protein|nr:hypothetical protein [Bacteroidota bacterium]
MNTLTTSAFSKTFAFVAIVIFLISGHSAISKSFPTGYFGIRGSAAIAASRFGTIYSPALTYQSGRNTMSFGATMQKKDKFSLSGFQLTYEFTLLDPLLHSDCNLEWFELYSFLHLGYHNRVFLGKQVCDEENICNKELKTDPAQLKLKAIEGYAGFGFRVKLYKNLKWFNVIGIGGYDVLGSTKGLFYSNYSAGIMVKTGLSYQFEKRQRGSY